MDDFVDIWRVFNLAFLEFMIYLQFFWLKIEIVITNATYITTYIKKIYFNEKRIFQYGRVLWRGDFLGKIRPCFHHSSSASIEST